MATIRAPKTVPAATKLCERFAELDGAIADIEERRTAALATVNAEADSEAQDLIAERDTIRAKLAEWWPGAAELLTKGERKKVELGGCEIGTHAGADSLAVEGDEAKIAIALYKMRWAKNLVRVAIGLKKREILLSLDGGHKDALAELGLSRKVGDPIFVLKRTAQGGTMGRKS